MDSPTLTRGAKAGLPPGTLLFTGEPRAAQTTLSLLAYNAASCEERTLDDVEACRACTRAGTVHWLNVDGLHDVGVIQRIGEIFGIHPLALEDIVTLGQRPRLEDYGETLFLVVKMLYRRGPERRIMAEQLSLVLGTFGVITFQEVPGDIFGPIRERIRGAKGRIRGAGPDYLAYRLLDTVIDNYFLILEDASDRVEAVQEHVLAKPDPALIHDIHGLKRDILFLRKAVWPVREVIGGLQKSESRLIDPATGIFLRDAGEHVIQSVDMIETMRDSLAGVLDIHLSAMSNRMNEIMRVLTVISTLFIPLTFIVGVYGMNFAHMPELAWRHGYAGVWAVMLVTAAALLAVFRRRRWL